MIILKGDTTLQQRISAARQSGVERRGLGGGRRGDEADVLRGESRDLVVLALRRKRRGFRLVEWVWNKEVAEARTEFASSTIFTKLITLPPGRVSDLLTKAWSRRQIQTNTNTYKPVSIQIYIYYIHLFVWFILWYSIYFNLYYGIALYFNTKN